MICKKSKTETEINAQCERIFNLHIIEGFGTDGMMSRCEMIYLSFLSRVGY